MRVGLLLRAWLAALLVGALALLWLAGQPEPRDPARLAALFGGRRSPLSAEPLAYWHHRRAFPEAYAPGGCARLPPRHALDRALPHWQRLRLRGGELLLYAAHWDARFDEPAVRVLAYSTVSPPPPLYCRLWYFRVGAARAVRARATHVWPAEMGAPADGGLEPYLVSCAAPGGAPPAAVSLALRPCADAANALRVQGPPLPPDVARDLRIQQPAAPPNASVESSVAVCLKWIDFQEDVSVRLTEWLQLLLRFGAERVFVYVRRAHPNVLNVLRYHESIGLVSMTQLWLPHSGAAPVSDGPASSPTPPPLHSRPTLKLELLPLNDCLYRAVARYEWLAALDLDELIVPTRDGAWGRLVQREARDGRVDALVFDNYYFPDTDPRPAAGRSLLARVWRARLPSPRGWFSKSLHSTRSVVAMHNHMPALCGAAERECRVRHVEGAAARLHHYRECEPAAACRDLVRDQTLQRWHLVHARVLAALRAAGLTHTTAGMRRQGD